MGVPTWRLDDDFSVLSGGDQQRVNLARLLLLRRSRLWLLDEPTSALDVPSAVLCVRMLLAVARYRGCRVALATHQPSVIRLMDRSLVVERQGQNRVMRWATDA